MPKRALLFCALFAACAALLCACSSQGAGSAPQSGAPKAESPQPLALLHDADETAEKIAYTEDGRYYFGERHDQSFGNNLLYMDYKTRQSVVVCEKPDCLHNDETCSAFFPKDTGPTSSCVINGSLYILFSGSQTEVPCLIRMDLNGRNRTRVCDFPSDFSFSSPLATDGASLYTLIKHAEIGEKSEVHTTSKLISISLEDGSTAVLHEWDCDAHLWGAENQFLYIMVPQHSDGFSFDFEVQQIDAGGALSGTQPYQGIAPFYRVANNTIYWYDQDKTALYSRSLNSSQAEVLAEVALPEKASASIPCVLQPYLFLEVFVPGDVGGKYYYKVYDMEQKAFHEVRLYLFETETDNKLIRVSDLIGDSFLVKNREQATTVTGITSDGQVVAFDSFELTDAFISIDDFLNSRPSYEEVKMPQLA